MQDVPKTVSTSNPTMVEHAERLRAYLKDIEVSARAYAAVLKSTNEELYDKGEMIAQAMLALRHIEDARMRFGKVIQYADLDKKGESVYPR